MWWWEVGEVMVNVSYKLSEPFIMLREKKIKGS